MFVSIGIDLITWNLGIGKNMYLSRWIVSASNEGKALSNLYQPCETSYLRVRTMNGVSLLLCDTGIFNLCSLSTTPTQ